MRAIVQTRYGSADDLELREIAKPIPTADEVLVRVRAASVHPDVWHVISGRPYALRMMGSGLRRPKTSVPGTDLAGVVAAVGEDVTQFAPGDEVFGESLRGYSWANGGAYAEYASVPAANLAVKPGAVSFEQAAAVPTSGFIALLNVRDQGKVQAGQDVLVNGAAGGVGSLVVQLAKAYGASVIGVDSAEKLELVRSLGADKVIDYAREDFTRAGECYDLIIDIPGNHSFAQCRRALTPTGRYVLVGHDHFGRQGHRVLGNLPRFVTLMAMSLFVTALPKPTGSTATKSHSIAVMRELLDTGQITPVIARTYPLSEAANAIRYMTEGHACGRVVITV